MILPSNRLFTLDLNEVIRCWRRNAVPAISALALLVLFAPRLEHSAFAADLRSRSDRCNRPRPKPKRPTIRSSSFSLRSSGSIIPLRRRPTGQALPWR